MTLNEFSLQFDIFYNNITSNQAPGLNEYEKSVFLTNAELQIVKEYFNQRTDSVGGGFDNSEIRQYDFSSIVRTENLFHINTFTERINEDEKLDKRSFVYLLPKNLFLFINEILYDDSNNQYSVIPIHYTEYQRLMSKPYNYPAKRNAWRMITDKKNCNYFEEYATITTEGSTVKTNCNYRLLSSWADQKRKLKVNVRVQQAEITATEEYFGAYAVIKYTLDGNDVFIKINADCGWVDSNPPLVYEVNLVISANDISKIDDETAVNIIKTASIKSLSHTMSKNSSFAKAIRHTDGFINAEAPSKFKQFQGSGKDIVNFSIVEIPMVEIIGNFNKAPEYHMHYVVKPTPIILTDLSVYGTDVSIDGVQSATECILPEKMHHEILERAVALAKTAWQSTQA